MKSSTWWNERAGNYEGNQYDKAITLELFGTEYNHWTVSLPVIKFIFMLFMLICIRINNTHSIHIQFQFTLGLTEIFEGHSNAQTNIFRCHTPELFWKAE